MTTYLHTDIVHLNRFKRDLAKQHPFFDFSGVYPETQNNYYYRETSHYRDNLGQQILGVMFRAVTNKAPGEFGAYIDRENIDYHLEILNDQLTTAEGRDKFYRWSASYNELLGKWERQLRVDELGATEDLSSENCHVEHINGQLTTEPIELSYKGDIEIGGWYLRKDRDHGSLVISLHSMQDDRVYWQPAYLGFPRSDIAAFFDDQVHQYSGFTEKLYQRPEAGSYRVGLQFWDGQRLNTCFSEARLNIKPRFH